MAIVYTRVASYPDKYENVVDITLDASYAANGYLINAAQCGMSSITNIDGNMSTGEGFGMTYVASTGKLKIFKSSAGAAAFTEVSNTDLTTAMKARVTVTGIPAL